MFQWPRRMSQIWKEYAEFRITESHVSVFVWLSFQFTLSTKNCRDVFVPKTIERKSALNFEWTSFFRSTRSEMNVVTSISDSVIERVIERFTGQYGNWSCKKAHNTQKTSDCIRSVHRPYIFVQRFCTVCKGVCVWFSEAASFSGVNCCIVDVVFRSATKRGRVLPLKPWSTIDLLGPLPYWTWL